MLSFVNKPVKNWTLAEAKEYCENKLKDEDCEVMEEAEVCEYCKLAKCNICCNEPKYFNFNEIPTKEIKNKCDTCLHSRVIISENGYHSICCLSSKQAVKCMMNNYNKYITLPEKEENNNA